MVYVLRMQQERMSESFVPSLREYAARYQISPDRLSPAQLLMHPGPVNRGVELSAEAIAQGHLRGLRRGSGGSSRSSRNGGLLFRTRHHPPRIWRPVARGQWTTARQPDP